MTEKITHQFIEERNQRIASYQGSKLAKIANEFIQTSTIPQYSYNFNWLGRPIIQYPQDMTAMQEIIWSVKPNLIIETGIAHGGSLIFSASMLTMIEYCEAVQKNEVLDPGKPKRRVLGIDIDIREHNRIAIKKHPMAGRIDMIEDRLVGIKS